jgi:hypothetical protein
MELAAEPVKFALQRDCIEEKTSIEVENLVVVDATQGLNFTASGAEQGE